MNKKILIICVILSILGCNSHADETRKMKAEIQNAIERVNYCSQDSDCKLADFNCPFGNSLVNKNADLSKIKKMISKYENTYGTCIYDIVAPKKEEIQCKAKKCIDTRF